MCLQPLISIIVPVYNTIDYIQDCIDSIISQTFQDFELILVDDGSTDGSDKVCDLNASKNASIRVIHQNNAGVSKARWAGFKNANGKYICFVDSDDTLDADYLSNLYSGLSNGIDIVFVENHEEVIDGDSYFKGLMKGQYGWEMWNKFFLKNILTPQCFDLPRNLTIGEDFITNLLIAKNVNKASIIPYAGYKFRVRESSVTHTQRASYEHETLFISELDKALIDRFQYYLAEIWHIRMKSWRTLVRNNVRIPDDSRWMSWLKENRKCTKPQNMSEKVLLNIKTTIIQCLLLRLLDWYREKNFRN